MAAWLWRLPVLLHYLLFTGCCICSRVLNLGQLVSSEGFLQTPPHVLHQVFLFPGEATFYHLNVVTQYVGAQLWLSVSSLIRRVNPLKGTFDFRRRPKGAARIDKPEKVRTPYLMSSSVTTKALQSGCVVLSHTPGFFSTAAVSWPVTGAGLVCRALAMAERSVLSELEGPTPDQSKGGARNSSLVPTYRFPTNHWLPTL